MSTDDIQFFDIGETGAGPIGMTLAMYFQI